MRWLAQLVVIAIVNVSFANVARADERTALLADARRLEAQLEFEPALAIVERVIARGGAERDQLVELYLFAGKLAAGLDRAVIAEEHYARVLALAPATTLPAGTSPKLTAAFDAARARTQPLQIASHIDDKVVALVVTADPLQLVRAIVVRTDDGRELRGVGLQVELPPDAFAADVIALDAWGNRLWRESRTRPAAGPSSRSPLYARWSTWAIAGAASLTVGSIGAWRFRVAQDDWNRMNAEGTHDYSALLEVEDRGRRWSIVANVGLGVAAAAGITAAVLAATRRDEPRVAFTATAHSIGLVGRF